MPTVHKAARHEATKIRDFAYHCDNRFYVRCSDFHDRLTHHQCHNRETLRSQDAAYWKVVGGKSESATKIVGWQWRIHSGAAIHGKLTAGHGLVHILSLATMIDRQIKAVMASFVENQMGSFV